MCNMMNGYIINQGLPEGIILLIQHINLRNVLGHFQIGEVIKGFLRDWGGS